MTSQSNLKSAEFYPNNFALSKDAIKLKQGYTFILDQ